MAEAVCCGKPAVVFQIRMVFYGLLIFFSFFIFAGISIMKDAAYERGAACPLYVQMEDHIGFSMGEDSVCNFPLAVAVIFQLLYVVFRVFSLCFDNKGKINEENRYCLFNGCMELFYVVVELLALVFTFIGACILSAGKNSACQDDACAMASWTSPATAAEAGAWISAVLWLATFSLDVIIVYRSGKVCRGGGAKSEAVCTDDPDNCDVSTDNCDADGVRSVPETTSTENPNFRAV